MAVTSADKLHIDEGTCHVLFAYHVGWSIDLEECDRRIVAGKERASLKYRRRAPDHFEYEPPPLRIWKEAESVTVGKHTTRSQVELVLFEFGVVSVGYRMDLQGPFEDLLALSDHLYDCGALADHSRHCVEQLLDVLATAVVGPDDLGAPEDYTIYEIRRWSPGLKIEEIADGFGAMAVQILRAEPDTLSQDEIRDAQACRISYTPDDLTLIDWNAGMIFDDQAEDVVELLEFVNAQLAEIRHLDDRLDEAMNLAYEVLRGTKRKLFFLPRGISRDLRRVAEMQADNAMLFEGVSNAVKLVGDQYLARVHRLASQRFHMAQWDKSIARKLETLDGIFQRIADQASCVRMEILEWIIIVLIAVSILMPLLTSWGY